MQSQVKLTKCYCCDKTCQDNRGKEGSGAEKKKELELELEHCVVVCKDCDDTLCTLPTATHLTADGTDSFWWESEWKSLLDEYKRSLQKKQETKLNVQCDCCSKPVIQDKRPVDLRSDLNYGMLCQTCYGAHLKNLGSKDSAYGDIYINRINWKTSIERIRTNLNNQQEGNTNMPYDDEGNEVTLGEMMKDDAKNAAYRVVANQVTKGVKGAIQLSLKDRGTEESKLEAIREFFNTDIGEALIAAGLGYGVLAIPTLKDDPRIKHLSDEFRIDGMAKAGNALADNVLKHIMPVMTDAMKNLPPLPEALSIKKPARKRVKIDAAPTAETTSEPVEAAPVSTPEPKKASKTTHAHQ